MTPSIREALEGLVEAVRRDADEGGKGISGYTSARLSDARAALAENRPALTSDEAAEAMSRCDYWSGRKSLSATEYPDEAAIRADEREKCARIVEQGQETIVETDDGSQRYLSPRNNGNLSGLAFAAAIRAGGAK